MTSYLTSEVKWCHWGQKCNFTLFFKYDHFEQCSRPSLTLRIEWPHNWPLRSNEVTEAKFLNLFITCLCMFQKGGCLRAKRATYIRPSNLFCWLPVSEANHVYPTEPPPHARRASSARSAREYKITLEIRIIKNRKVPENQPENYPKLKKRINKVHEITWKY